MNDGKREDYIAWARYKHGKKGVTIHLCNSNDEGAFKVYRYSAKPTGLVRVSRCPCLCHDIEQGKFSSHKFCPICNDTGVIRIDLTADEAVEFAREAVKFIDETFSEEDFELSNLSTVTFEKRVYFTFNGDRIELKG